MICCDHVIQTQCKKIYDKLHKKMVFRLYEFCCALLVHFYLCTTLHMWHMIMAVRLCEFFYEWSNYCIVRNFFHMYHKSMACHQNELFCAPTKSFYLIKACYKHRKEPPSLFFKVKPYKYESILISLKHHHAKIWKKDWMITISNISFQTIQIIKIYNNEQRLNFRRRLLLFVAMILWS